MKLIPFNIEYYNAHPDCKVVYRGGGDATVICTNRNHATYKVVSDSGHNTVLTHTTDGRENEGRESFRDLLIQLPSTTRPFTPEEITTELIGKWLIRTKENPNNVYLIRTNVQELDKAKQEDCEISPVGDGKNWTPMCKNED